MAYDSNGRGGLLSAGGILSIIVGVFEVIGGGLIAALMAFGIPFWQRFSLFFPRFGGAFGMAAIPTWLIIIGIVLAILGIVAVVGGISAIRRKSFGLSLAGAICALLPINLLGILAVIFVSLAKGEFGAAEE
jgi:hypothetical protein